MESPFFSSNNVFNIILFNFYKNNIIFAYLSRKYSFKFITKYQKMLYNIGVAFVYQIKYMQNRNYIIIIVQNIKE